MTINTQVKGVEIIIDTRSFQNLFELPYGGISYDYDRPSKFERFIINSVVVGFMEDPIGEKKLPFRTKFLKAKCQVSHYMLTWILLPRQRNIEDLVR